jgi:hypothetical protein
MPPIVRLTKQASTRGRPNVAATILAAQRTVDVVLSYTSTQLGARVTTPELLDSGAGAEEDATEDSGAAAVTLQSQLTASSVAHTLGLAGVDGDDRAYEKGVDCRDLE